MKLISLIEAWHHNTRSFQGYSPRAAGSNLLANIYLSKVNNRNNKKVVNYVQS